MKKILILIFVVWCFSGCGPVKDLFKESIDDVENTEGISIAGAEGALAESIAWSQPKELNLKRDIFAPLVVKPQEENVTARPEKEKVNNVSFLTLLGTIVSDQPVAFIYNTADDKSYVVREKGYVGSFQAIEVRRKEVILRKDGENYTLKILEAKP